MKIKAFALYAAPTNHYSPPSPTLNLNSWSFHQFLSNEFLVTSGELENTRSVKIVKDLIVIRLPMLCPVPFTANILELQQPDNSYVYFTITGHQSEDDGATKPTTTISALFDSWMNYVSNKPYGWLFGSEEMFVKTGTLGLWTGASTPKPKCRIDGDAGNFTHRTVINIDTGKSIIWAKIRCDDEVWTTTEAGTPDPGAHSFGMVRKQFTTPIIYVPIGIVEVGTYGLNANTKRYVYLNGWQTFNPYEPTPGESPFGYGFNSSHIMSVEYTTQVPFAYTVASKSATEVRLTVNSSHYIVGLPGCKESGVYKNIYNGYAIIGRKSGAPSGATTTHTAYNNMTLSSSSRDITGTVKENLYAPVLKSMPYDFSVLKCGDIVLPVSYNDPSGSGVACSLIVDMDGVSQPFVLQRRGTTQALDIGNVVNVNAFGIRKVDNEELYNRNAGASEQVAKNLHFMKNMINVGNGLIQSVKSKDPVKSITAGTAAIFDEYSYTETQKALGEDMRNQQDIFSIPAAVGEERMQFLDQVMTIDYITIDEREKQNALNRIHRFGFGCSCYAPIVQNRIWFDYYQLAEVHADKITNTDHRAVIENTFRSGVRIWYFYSTQGSTQPAITCDLTRNNPDITIANT